MEAEIIDLLSKINMVSFSVSVGHCDLVCEMTWCGLVHTIIYFQRPNLLEAMIQDQVKN